MPEKTRNPLEPFASTVSILLRIAIGLLVSAVVFALFTKGSHWSVSGLTDRTICVHDNDISSGAANTGGLEYLSKPGVQATNAGVDLCTEHATAWQRTLRSLGDLPAALFGIGALLLMWWLVRGARQDGPFASANARRVRWFGWWLIIGGLISDNLTGVAKILLLRTMLAHSDDGPYLIDGLTVPWSLLLTGLGMLTVARILSAGVTMREEIEATI